MSTREAIRLNGVPMGASGEDGVYYEVGQPYYRRTEHIFVRAGVVTRITVTDDLPGLHCFMERVRVFDGEHLIYEAPLHSLEGVAYAAPADAEGRS